jgi:hypothetical protein
MAKLRMAKAEKATFRITFARCGSVKLPELQRTPRLYPLPFVELGAAGFPDTSNISYNPSKHQYL